MITKTTIGVLFQACLLAFPGLTLAASVLDAAKKEGVVVLYAAGNVEDFQKLNGAFEKKYPFLKVQLFRANWERVRNRATTEARAGSHFVDVLHVDGINGWILKEQNLLQPHKSRETDDFPQDFKDPTGLLPCCFDILTNVIGFNTKLVPRQDAPKTYTDLLQPRWKGRLGMDADEGEWFAALVTIWGKEKTADYFRSLMKQEPSSRRGHTLLANLTAAGEFAVAVNLFGYRVLEMQAKGEAIDLVHADPLVVRPAHLSLARQAPHPNAARLYMDFVFSVEGQQIIASVGRTVIKPGVQTKYGNLVEGIKLHPVKPEMAKNYEETSKLYYSIVK
ncbi:MAG: extracellular solute-binding protein [Deltaproteobacteria bacterium]|nr:extracellular solute-binding protein [Deltaproteobacteria bacterium]